MGLMKKLTSGLVAASLVFGLVGTAFADMNDSNAVKAAADRMVALKVVDGVPGVGLDLGSNLTRAQVVKIIVAAYGQKDTAALLASAPSFSDVKGHWASGYIALAKAKAEQNGFTLGYPDGTFKPEGSITFAEVLGLLEKFMGVQATAGLSYPNNVIDAAVNAGLIDAKDKATVSSFPNAAITRGQAFYLADTAFSTKVNGAKSVYQTYDSTTQPSVTVDANSYTATTTATSATIKGTVANATSLMVNGQAVTVAADGSWSATVALDKVGANTVTIVASDLIGNTATPASPVTITRNAGAAATIQASLSSATLTAGGTATLSVKVLDANGVELKDAQYTVTADAAVGTYDAATGTFTAAKTPATGNLTITSGSATATVAVTVGAGALDHVVASATSAAPGQKVTLTAKDANNNTISSGVTYSQTSADALLDGTQGVFIASKAGNYTVTATAGGVSKDITIGVYAGADHLKFTTTPATMVANGDTAYDVKVAVVDANGNIVGNSGIVMNIGLPAGVTATDANGATITSVTASNGMASFKVVADANPGLEGQVLPLTVSPATVGDLAQAANGAATVNLSTVAQVPTSLKVTAPAYMPTSNAGGVTVSYDVVDQNGVSMASASDVYYPLTVTVTGPASLSSTPGVQSSTSYSYNASGSPANSLTLFPVAGQTGPVTVTATAAGLGTQTATLQSTYPGNAAKLAVKEDSGKTSIGASSTSTVTVDLQLTDAAGVPVDDSSSVTVTVKDSSGAAVDLTDVASFTTNLTGATSSGTGTVVLSNGAASFTFGSTVADTYTFTTSISGKSYTFGSYSLAVNPAAADHFAFVKSAVAVPVTNPTGNVSVQVYDVNGNKVKQAGIPITFTVADSDTTSLTGGVASLTVNTDAYGVATTSVTTRPFAGTAFSVTAAGPTGYAVLSGGSATVAVTPANQIAKTITVKLYNNSTGYQVNQVTAGTQVYVRATIADQYGAPITGNAEAAGLSLTVPTIIWDTVSSSLTSALPAGAAFAWNGSAYELQTSGVQTLLTIGKSGVASFSVKDNTAVTDVTGTASLSVLPNKTAAALQANIAEADSTSTLSVTKGGISGPFTLQLTDAYGNVVTGALPQNVSIASDSSEVTFRSTQDGLPITSFSNVVGPVKFYVVTTSAVPVAPSTLPQINITVGGNTYHFNVSAK